MADPVTPEPDEELIRARQKERSRLLAWLLAAFVVLMFFITVAKMSLNQ